MVLHTMQIGTASRAPARTTSLETADRLRSPDDELEGRVPGAVNSKSPTALSSLVAPGLAILPFAAVLAVCVGLLSLPPRQGSGTRNSPAGSVSDTIEPRAPEAIQARAPDAIESRAPDVIQSRAPDVIQARAPEATQSRASPSAGAEQSPEVSPVQPQSVEVADVPSVSEPVTDIASDPIHMMSKWWAQRPSPRRANTHKAAVISPQKRRHREAFQHEQGCPPSVCIGSAPRLPNPRKWLYGGS
jgi:hypothetical protein